jgi:hypothetical protein
MKKGTARTLMIIVGVLFLFAILGVGSAVWLFTRAVNVASADAKSAERSFEEIRQKFGGVTPILEVRGDDPVISREPPEQTTGEPLTSLRIVAWDDTDERFTQIDLPFWLLRLKKGPIQFSHQEEVFGRKRLLLTVEQLERYGPTLVLDHQPRRGGHVIVWTE